MWNKTSITGLKKKIKLINMYKYIWTGNTFY